MYGAVDGQRLDIPIAEMIAMVGSKSADVRGSFRGSIRSVDEEGDAAIAVVDEQGFWGAL
jgi:hypothetical protein